MLVSLATRDYSDVGYRQQFSKGILVNMPLIQNKYSLEIRASPPFNVCEVDTCDRVEPDVRRTPKHATKMTPPFTM